MGIHTTINCILYCILLGVLIGFWVFTTLEAWLFSDDDDSLYDVLKSQWRWIRSKRLW